MEVLTYLCVALVVMMVLLLWLGLSTKHMRDFTRSMPGVKRVPYMAMIQHVFTKHKGSTYNLYNIVEKIIAPFPHLSKGWVGSFCLIDIRNPEYLKTVLNSDKCIDRAAFYSFPYKTGLLVSGGDLWRRHRKILNPAFSTNKLNKFLPIVNGKARKLTDVLSEHVGNDAFNIIRLLSAFTLESLLRTSFGLEKDFINNPYDKFFAIVKKEATNIGNNITNMFNLFMPRRHRKNDFTSFCEQILVEAEQESDELFRGDSMNFIETLLKNKSCLTNEEIQDEVSTMILAGNASTALSMSSALLMLAMHPEVQEKLVQELNSVFNDDEDEVDNEKLKSLKYLDLVVKETLRLFPVAPVIGRKVTSDLILDDNYTLPEGADVVIRIIDVQRNPTLWGDDAHLFNPERFLDENLKKVHPYAFIPFSAGSRICIGYRYALNAMKIVLCHVLRRFKVQTPLKYDELKLEISFVLRISQNYMIQLQPRNYY